LASKADTGKIKGSIGRVAGNLLMSIFKAFLYHALAILIFLKGPGYYEIKN
jgi:hypothetical protein